MGGIESGFGTSDVGLEVISGSLNLVAEWKYTLHFWGSYYPL